MGAGGISLARADHKNMKGVCGISATSGRIEEKGKWDGRCGNPASLGGISFAWRTGGALWASVMETKPLINQLWTK